MYGDPKDIIISFMAGHGIRDAMMFPAEFGSSWTQGSSDNCSYCDCKRTWTNTSRLPGLCLMGFPRGPKGPLIQHFLYGPAH